ncbi:MAG: signal recognition particle-docking protein FtsY [Verrucomicrobia bacterium GWC2_42_7]|nr:MAG: signal recognition particle-docking protein FtsY [Verrucomicrobia bacterium GWC2_42_7]
MFNLFQKFKVGLSKTAKRLFGAVGGIFGIKQLDESSIEQLEEALYCADFGVQTTQEIIEEIRIAYKKDKNLHGKDAAAIGSKVLQGILTGAEVPFQTEAKPTTICLIGVNGSGKTTTAAKLAYLFQKDGKKVILGACDTFRAAANEQIASWANRLKIDLIASQHGGDAAAVAFDAYQAAVSRSADILILDTAGRLHTKSNLVEELKKIKRVLQKQNPQAPHHSWLVVDGSLGSNSIEQARVFHKEFGLSGLIITKLDGTSRGGALVGIFRELKLPILFVGLGEQPDDLQPFSVGSYVSAIFTAE